jgi:hypothetical protein
MRADHAWALVAVLAACSTAEDPPASPAGGGGATGSTSSKGASSSAGPTSTGTQAVATVGTGGTGGVPEECNPAPAPGSFGDQPAAPYENPTTTVKMCRYRGKVKLIFVAAAL